MRDAEAGGESNARSRRSPLEMSTSGGSEYRVRWLVLYTGTRSYTFDDRLYAVPIDRLDELSATGSVVSAG